MSVDLKAIKERLANESWACWNCGADLTATEGTERTQKALGDDVRALVAEVEALRALLREVEWSGGDNGGICPVCGADEPTPTHPPCPAPTDPKRPLWRGIRFGHEDDCRLSSAIREEP
jgi:hypothetical protein